MASFPTYRLTIERWSPTGSLGVRAEVEVDEDVARALLMRIDTRGMARHDPDIGLDSVIEALDYALHAP